MKLHSAIKYYTQSFFTILKKTNFWIIPFLTLKLTKKMVVKNDCSFYVNSLIDFWTIKEVILDDCYHVLGKKYRDVVNIGSGVGDFDVMMSSCSSRIFSYDASSNRSNLVKQNLKLNKISNVFFEKRFVTSLNDIFESNSILDSSLLKIDCEGAEYEIFKNTSDVNLLKLKRIVGEIHFFNDNMKNDYAVLKTRFHRLGFEIIETPNPVHENIIFFEARKKLLRTFPQELADQSGRQLYEPRIWKLIFSGKSPIYQQ